MCTNFTSDFTKAYYNMIQRGELIVYTGMTGNANELHLHLKLYQNGKAVNQASTRIISENLKYVK